MSELMSEHLKYIGRIKEGDGVKKDGIPWVRWKLAFKKGEKYSWEVKAFDSLPEGKSLQAKDLVEDKYYEIVYKMNEFIGKHGPGKSKQAILIKDSSEENSTENRLATPPQSQLPEQLGETDSGVPTGASPGDKLPVKKFAVNDWVKFAQSYDAVTEGRGQRSPIHMLGVYAANKHKEEFIDIIVLCKKHFQETV